MLTPPEYELLISSVSHEIRNPVTLIGSYLQLMGRTHPEIAAYREWLPIQTEMEYLRQLLDDLSGYQNGSRLEPENVDTEDWLCEYLQGARALIRSLAGSGITLQTHLEAGLPVLSMDPVKLHQVLDNLIRNSVEAIGPHSTGTIAFSATCRDQTLRIRITDTGCGIPPEQLDSIFRPFFSGKSHGSGLGLAISQRIIQAHGGTLTASSSYGESTAFTLCLPITGIHPVPDDPAHSPTETVSPSFADERESAPEEIPQAHPRDEQHCPLPGS